MAIDLCDLANILDKIFHSEPWKWLLEHQDFRILTGENPPDHKRFTQSAIAWFVGDQKSWKVGQSGLDNFFKLQFFFLQRGIDLYILHHPCQRREKPPFLEHSGIYLINIQQRQKWQTVLAIGDFIWQKESGLIFRIGYFLQII